MTRIYLPQPLAERCVCTRVSLGPRILRTETAGVAALAILQALREEKLESEPNQR